MDSRNAAIAGLFERIKLNEGALGKSRMIYMRSVGFVGLFQTCKGGEEVCQNLTFMRLSVELE